jgi:hypothetical protein
MIRYPFAPSRSSDLRILLVLSTLLVALPALGQQSPAAPTVLLEGTPISLKLDETLSSATAKVGQHVAFLVTEDVKARDTTIIPIGSNAIGTVTVAEPKKWAGRAGKLDVNIDSVRLPTGQKVLLSATRGGNGGGHGAAVTAGVIGTSLVFFPAAPLLLMIHGKDMVIAEGTPVKAFVSGDTTITPAAHTGEAQ